MANNAIVHQPDIKAGLPGRGFGSDALEALSAYRGEPTWALEKRHKGWYRYQQLEAPLWRRTDIGKLRWEELIPYAPPQVAVDGLDALPPKLAMTSAYVTTALRPLGESA